tara:strand:+ start:258 stop:845 length:588 start_codon:yes stop_codon:yes gene_type:complete
MKKTVDIEHTKYVDLNQWYWFQSVFNDEEIERIEKIAEKVESQEGQAGREGGAIVKSARSSKIKWLMPSEENAWIYQKLGECIAKANDVCWKFDWEGHTDNIQYTEYYATEEGRYNWHVDVGNGTMSMRKMSAVLLLNDDYEGGDLQIKAVGENLDKTKGNLFIFPSYLLHRVTTVTKGMRKSLVIWAGGPQPFK